MNEKYCSIIQIYILSISMHIQNFIEIHKIIHKILSINKILMSIKGHNSVKNWPKIMCIWNNIDFVFINAYTKFYQNSSFGSEDIEEKHIFTSIKGHNSFVYKRIQPICNPKPLLPDINVHAKFEEIGQKLLKLESGNDIFTSVKGHNSVFINEFSPFAIPNHSSPISISMQSLKKISQKLLKSPETKRWRTDGWTLKIFGGYNIIPHHFLLVLSCRGSIVFVKTERGFWTNLNSEWLFFSNCWCPLIPCSFLVTLICHLQKWSGLQKTDFLPVQTDF